MVGWKDVRNETGVRLIRTIKRSVTNAVEFKLKRGVNVRIIFINWDIGMER